ncbi:MAG: hypothetical protein JWQ76_1342, partial [Ramlibacter sp.]|nr:hypothetical protein [Ramlibacter sp.]
MKARKTSIANRLREAFRLEPLEPRVLLSADPVLGAAQAVLAPVRDQDQLALEAYDSGTQIVAQQPSTQASAAVVADILRLTGQSRGMAEFAVDSAAFDLAKVQDRLGFLEGAFDVQPGQKMGGSGQITMDVYNDGVISPGYSPGRIDITGDYTQTGTLTIELGGAAPGTGYDQLNVSGTASLDGTLELKLYGNFRPTDGETFDIVTFGSALGAFDVGTGFVQKDAGLWFDIEQMSNGLRLTAHEVDPTLAYLLDVLPATATNSPLDSVGQWINHDYFSDVTPTSFTGQISLGSNLYLDGTFTFGYDADNAVTDPNTGTSLNADFWKLSVSNGTGKLGLDINNPSALGFQLSDVDFGLLYVKPTDASISHGWLLTEGTIGTLTGALGPLTLASTTLPLDFELSWATGDATPGVPASKALDLSGANAVDVGNGHVFDSDGARGEFLLLSGSMAGALDTITLAGKVGLSIDGSAFVMAASEVTASVSGGGMSVGLHDGEFGLVSSAAGTTLEARGAADFNVSGFTMGADAVRIAYNGTGTDFTGTELSFAGDYGYTFGAVPQGPGFVAASATGVKATVGDAVAISGDFAFQRSASGDTMAVIGQHVQAAVSAGDFNIGIGDGELALLVHADGLALEASGALAASLGQDVSLSAATVALRLNERATSLAGTAFTAGTLNHTFGAGMTANAHDLAIGGAQIMVGEFLHASGDLAVHWGDQATLSLAGGGTVLVNQLLIGGTGLSGQVGLNTGSTDFIGLAANNVELALGLFTDAANDARGWRGVKAKTGQVAFEGMAGLTLVGNNLDIVGNLATNPLDPVLDFGTTSVNVATGPASSITLDMAGARGTLLEASGTLDVDAFGFFHVSGGFAFERSTTSLTLADGEVVDAQMFTIGAANADAFVGVGGDRADKVGLDLHGVAFGLALASDVADPTRSWTSLSASATSIAVVGVEGLTLSASDLTVAVNSASMGEPVVDYAAQSLVVATGPGTSITLDMDGQRGTLLEARGTLSVDAFGFFQVSGSFALTKSTESVTLDDGSVVPSVDLLTLGADGVHAFAGVDGGTPQAVGLDLDDVGFALALMREQLPAASASVARQWSALQASAGSASLVGVSGITASVSSVFVRVNRADIAGHVVDFAASPLDVATGPGLATTFDMAGSAGATLSASGQFALDVRGFFQASGSLAIERRQDQLTLADRADTVGVDESGNVDVDLLTLGGSGLAAFVGINGGTAQALGAAIGGVDFALVLATEHGGALRHWQSLQASAASVALVGVDGLTLSGDQLSVQVNDAAVDGVVIDYAAQSLAVLTGPGTTLTLDLDGAAGVLRRASGHLAVDLFGFLQAEGSFALESRAATVTLADGSSVLVDLLAFGADGVDAFAGTRGGSAEALGFALTDVNVALALMRQHGGTRSWTSAHASAGSAGLVGTDGLVVTGESLDVVVNQAGTVGDKVVDFSAAPLTVATGPGTSATLDADGALGALLRASGHLKLDLFGFVQTEGDVAFEKSTRSVTLSDADVVQVDLLALSASNLDAFVGVNAGTDDAMGLELAHVNVALALMSAQGDPARRWVSLQATATSAGLVGLDAVTVQATGLEVFVNQAAAIGDAVVDYSAGHTALTLGAIALDMDGAQGELLRATGDLEIGVAGYFNVQGGFGIESRTTDVTLSDGSAARVRLLSIGANNVSAFAGINGGTGSAVGLSLGSVDFALALMADVKDPSLHYTSLQASAGLASFIGVNGLTVQADTLSVQINRGVQIAAHAAEQNKLNTQLQLVVGGSSGTLHFTKGSDSADVVLTAGESNAQLIADLTVKLESLDGIGAGNVLVNGTRIGGYTIEFTGTLAGQDVSGLAVSLLAADATATVGTTQAAQPGVNEQKQITLERLRGATPNVDVSVSQLVAMALGINEIKSIVFTTPYSTKGDYQISLGTATVTVRYVQNDVENNKSKLKAAFATLLGAATTDFDVTFDGTYTGGHRYDIQFRGLQAQRNIGDITVTEALSGAILPFNVRDGSTPSGETQRATIASGTATGTFKLSLNYLTFGTFTSADIAFGADAATVQAKLLAATNNASQTLASQGTIAVTKNGNDYDIAFGGGFAGRDLKNLQVALAV